jgi:hypothetical protein
MRYNMCTSQAVEAAEHSTRVNAIAPGFVFTPILGADKSLEDWNESAKSLSCCTGMAMLKKLLSLCASCCQMMPHSSLARSRLLTVACCSPKSYSTVYHIHRHCFRIVLLLLATYFMMYR